jgi:hypothetical protein
VRLLDESSISDAARNDERLAMMHIAAGDELFLADLTATMEDFRHADHNMLCSMLEK